MKRARVYSLHAAGCLLAASLLLLPSGLQADGGVTFTNVAEGGGAGVDFERGRSATFPLLQALRDQSLIAPVPFTALFDSPHRAHGLPGVAILDYDRDDDLDLYVTNGPGVANSLFQNQLADSGNLTFVDVGAASGAGAADQDSSGVCFGDLDNDGDHDLVVLGRGEPNRLFENLGGGFQEVPGALGGDGRNSLSCATGDVDGDGLLDLVVSNTWDFTDFRGCFVELFSENQHNQLLRNVGGLQFADVSAASGIEDLDALPPGAEGSATITWAIAMVDLDLDGDVEIVWADDQCEVPNAANGGVDRGYIHVWENDGAGNFTDRPLVQSPNANGAWMGLGFGDFDSNGHLDILASNFGDYAHADLGIPDPLGALATRWLLGTGNLQFADPGVGALVSSVFGWGNAVLDYDNDGDQDLLYHGGLDANFLVVSDNPGVLLRNDGAATFTYDDGAFATDYLRRNVQSVAVGDLDRDGFVDVVTASDLLMPEPLPLVPSPASFNSIFDPTAFFSPAFAPGPNGFEWLGVDFPGGDVTVEISSGGNGNGSVKATAVGAVGLIPGGVVNRDGIGAVVTFTPEGGAPVSTPVQGGSSFMSQHSLELHFGLGVAPQGQLDVLWPGGVRNRLYDVENGEHVVLPEIPCSFDADWQSRGRFVSCVTRALNDLRRAGVISNRDKSRYLASMKRAFDEG